MDLLAWNVLGGRFDLFRNLSFKYLSGGPSVPSENLSKQNELVE